MGFRPLRPAPIETGFLCTISQSHFVIDLKTKETFVPDGFTIIMLFILSSFAGIPIQIWCSPGRFNATQGTFFLLHCLGSSHDLIAVSEPR